MKVKHLYLILFLVGTIVPYWELINFVIENSLDFSLIAEQLLATRMSRFFLFDVVISAIVVLLFVQNEKQGVRYYWMAILATFTIGVSAGLPLFLYQRELAKEK